MEVNLQVRPDLSRVDSYDGVGRPTSTSLVVPAIADLIPAGLAGTYTVTTSYAPDGSVATSGLPATGPVGAETLTYGYNAKGAPASLTGMAALVKATAYTQWDSVASLSMGAASGHAVIALFDRDEATMRLDRIRTVLQVSGSTPVEDARYSYDAAGNVIQAKAAASTGTVDNQCFKYDFQGQLTEAFTADASVTCSASTTPSQSALGSGPSPYWTSWSTDTIGKTSQRVDRTASASSTTDYAYPANGGVRPHAVTETVTTGSSTMTHGYGYDAAGNTTARPGPSGAAQTLSYNTEGQLVQVAEGGSTVARMVYDAAGERVVKRENGKTTLTVAGTDLSVDNASGVKSASRYYSHAGQTVAVRTGNSNAELFTVVNDHQGTAHHQVRNSDSQLQSSWQDPFGGRRGVSPSSWAGLRGFVGGVNDVSTGLVRLGARDFDPVLQRFTSVDPVQVLDVPLQWNPYLYGDNSPVTKADPSGLCWICGIGNAIGSAFRGAVGVVRSAVSHVAGAVKAVATTVVKAVAKVAAKVVKTVAKVVKKVATAVKSVVRSVKAVVKSAARAVSSTAKKVVAKTKQAAKSVGDAVSRAANDDRVHLALDVIGMVPVVGEVADGLNAALYAAKGDYANAALSAAAMIPMAGIAATGTKLGIKAADKLVDFGKTLAKSCSFSGATVVLMADGTTKPIEDVQVGDRVVATDPETGERIAANVEQVFVHRDTVMDLVVDDKLIATTEDHPFWSVTDARFERADELAPGEAVLGADGRTVRVSGLKLDTQRPAWAYNLAVAGIHTYHVGTDAILVHNTCPLFSGGTVRGRSIIGVRTDLMNAGFRQGLSNNKKGYLFVNNGGDQVRIMRRGGGWDIRMQKPDGSYLDEYGKVAKDRASAHGIGVFSR